MKKYICIAGLLILLFISFFSCASAASVDTDTQARQRNNEPYFTGDGGKNIRLAVLEPAGKGLSASEQWMTSLVQGSITGDFNKFSAMTIIDRQNLDQILAEQIKSLSGDYSDEDYISIGKLTNARFILTGSISRTASAYMLELSVSDLETGERKASYPPKPVTLADLENLNVVKEASAELLGQLGVKLTANGLEELKKAAPVEAQAETALAKGIVAQKQGTEAAALSYYFQASALNPALFEAANRSSVMTAYISGGNIGADVRNDIQWRKDWIARLTETEAFSNDLFKNTSLAYTLFYSTEIEQGAHDYENETATFTIQTYLHASQAWAASVQRALKTVYDGLEATGRKEAWGFANWPRQSVSGLRPFDITLNLFYITMELLNDRNQVIGSATFDVGGSWSFLGEGCPELTMTSSDTKRTVSFRGINIDNLTGSLMIRIAKVEGYSIRTADAKAVPRLTETEMASIVRTQTADETGVLRIRTISSAEWKFYDSITMVKGTITSYDGDGEGGTLVLDTIWDDPVIAIGDKAFYHKFIEKTLKSQLTSIIIGNSVISIGEWAFRDNALTTLVIGDNVETIGGSAFNNNALTKITFPPSVKRIGYDAFWKGRFSTIIIGANVSFDFTVISSEFDRFYNKQGKRAGTYTNGLFGWSAKFE